MDTDSNQRKHFWNKTIPFPNRFGPPIRKLFSWESINLGCGALLIVSALFLTLFWDDFLKHQIRMELVLSPSSKSYSLWKENPIPLYVDFYFFEWTNPSNLLQADYVPNFQEKGPYRFREQVKKVEINWNENGTVTYKKKRSWYFVPDGSNGTLDDVITTLNVIPLTAARSTRYWNRITRIPLSLTMSGTQNTSLTKKVREFLFEGYIDPLIEFGSKIPGLSSKIPFDRFGWFYKRNGSTEFDGVFNMETGANGLNLYGKLINWNFKNRTSFYEGRCGDVLGSAGEFWPPERPKRDDIFLFSPDMCRYVGFKYAKEVILKDLKGYRYDSGPSLFDNGTTDPRNECFCGGKCSPSGVLNVTDCRFGAPAFVSYPHFHLADSFFTDSVSGLKPDPTKHDTYIILEQQWGIPLEVAIRLQINILLEPDSGIGMYRRVPTIFFPMLWFEQKVTVSDKISSEIRFLSSFLPGIGFAASITFYVLGSSCAAFYFSKHFGKRILREEAVDLDESSRREIS